MVHIVAPLALLGVAVQGRPHDISRGVVGRHRQDALLQSWNRELDSGKGNPIQRVVGLLKEMQTTLKKEMDEDEELYEKLECWCNTGKYEKENAITAGTSKIDELTSANEEGYARSNELKEQIHELETTVASDKAALKTASAKREQDIEAFHGMELDSIQAIENLKSALVVLSKHQDAFPQLAMSLLQESPLEDVHNERTLEAFMQGSGLEGTNTDSVDKTTQKFLQQDESPVDKPSGGWTKADVAIVHKAMKTMAFVQHKTGYEPAYQSQSGEIVGIMKTMKEQMESDLKESQGKEIASSATFDEMRTAKTAAIEAGEKMSEQKEDELARTDNLVAEAKEDLAQTEETLAEDKTFLANLEKMCSDGDAAFEKRKGSRLDEIKAVGETIEILTADEARDAMSGTYSLVQTSSHDKNRKAAAALLRRAGLKAHNPVMSMLATSVELDAFKKVQEAIDDMVGILKQQQEDEVKKNDYCKQEIQETEMTIAKTNDHKADLEAKIGELGATIVTLTDEIEAAKAAIVQAQMDLQRASEDRLRENLDFQRTVADQTMTIEVLHKAMNRLAEFYDAQFLQKSKSAHAQRKQTPPAQMEYKPNAGAGGVMSMIEKLIYDAKDLVANSKKSEGEAQLAYETLIADTNQSVDDLTTEVMTKTKASAMANKDKLSREGDLTDTMHELEGLSQYEADVHAECDYVLQNFDVRQQARAQEIEALQQAKQILSGANLS